MQCPYTKFSPTLYFHSHVLSLSPFLAVCTYRHELLVLCQWTGTRLTGVSSVQKRLIA